MKRFASARFAIAFFFVSLILVCQVHAVPIAVPSGMTGSDLVRMSQEGRHNDVVLLAPEIIKKHADIDAYIAFAWSLNSLKDYQRAKEIAQEGYTKFKDPRLAQALGEAFYNLGENENALVYLEEYLAKFPDGNKAAVSYALCGEIFIRMGKFNHADIAFSAALQYNATNARWWARLGWIREQTARYLLALKAYEQSSEPQSILAGSTGGQTRMLAKIGG